MLFDSRLLLVTKNNSTKLSKHRKSRSNILCCLLVIKIDLHLIKKLSMCNWIAESDEIHTIDLATPTCLAGLLIRSVVTVDETYRIILLTSWMLIIYLTTWMFNSRPEIKGCQKKKLWWCPFWFLQKAKT